MSLKEVRRSKFAVIEEYYAVNIKINVGLKWLIGLYNDF